MNADTPAGWYPDPHGTMRWWDGEQWTDRVEGEHGVQEEPVASEPASTPVGRPRKQGIIALVAVLLIAAAAGGLWWLLRDSSDGAQDVARDYAEAQVMWDWEHMCDLTASMPALLERSSAEDPTFEALTVPGSEEACEKWADRRAEQFEGVKERTITDATYTVASSRVEGDRAEVVVDTSWNDGKSERTGTVRMLLVRPDKEWLVAWSGGPLSKD